MAKKFDELHAWQLAEQLREEILTFTSKPPATKDFKYCDQIRESARSAPSNIAEGGGARFNRSSPRRR